MGDITAVLYALLGFIIVGSVIAIEAKDLLGTVISVAAAGAGLAIVFLLVGAPDLAITQIVVEVVTMVLLIRVAVRRDDTTLDKAHDMFNVAAGLVFLGILVVASVYAFGSMTPFGEPLMAEEIVDLPYQPVSKAYLESGFTETGAANGVTAVLLDFRAYDTLGEATVIFAAVIGAYAVLRHVGRKRNVAARNEPDC